MESKNIVFSLKAVTIYPCAKKLNNRLDNNTIKDLGGLISSIKNYGISEK